MQVELHLPALHDFRSTFVPEQARPQAPQLAAPSRGGAVGDLRRTFRGRGRVGGARAASRIRARRGGGRRGRRAVVEAPRAEDCRAFRRRDARPLERIARPLLHALDDPSRAGGPVLHDWAGDGARPGRCTGARLERTAGARLGSHSRGECRAEGFYRILPPQDSRSRCLPAALRPPGGNEGGRTKSERSWSLRSIAE